MASIIEKVKSDTDGTPNVQESWELDVEDLEIGDKLGGGSYGNVYSGHYLGTEVAIKIMNVEEFGAQNMAKYLVRELACSKFSHPNLVSFIGIAERVGKREVLLVTEKLSGHLRALIKTCPADIFTWPLRIGLASDAAKGLAFLHAKHIIHRDIKSKNMVLDEHKKLKICDFGFARTYQQAGRMTICGTEDWMAPELILGDPYDEKVDVFSYGVVLVEIITRKKIAGNFQRGPQDLFAMDISKVREATPGDCPPALLDLAIQCVSEEPANRPSFRTIIQKLNEIRVNLSTAPEPVEPPKSPSRVPSLQLNLNVSTVSPSKSPRLSPRASTVRQPRKARCNFVELNELCMSFDNEEQVEEILARVFSSSARNSWIVIGYLSPSTLAVMGSGNGGVEEMLEYLANDEVQYCLIRIPISKGELQHFRDVFIYWTGPNVSVLQRGKKKTHMGAVKEILNPFHAELQADNKEVFTEDNIRDRSEPLSGSHVL